MNPEPAHPQDVADIPPQPRYGTYVEKEGTLPKKGGMLRNNPLFHLNKKHRFLKIRGSNLKCYRKHGDPHPEWDIALQNANVTGDPERMEIEIRGWDRTESFAADHFEEYDSWYTALKSASEKSIKDYYGFIKTLGEGHFGKVLLARDRRTKEKFAVKVIKKANSMKDVRAQTLVQRELDILRLVNHPNIVRMYDLFDTSEKLYFVLEFMEGGALYDVLSSHDIGFSEERASCIVKDILNGLVYLHSKGIVHRDVKPENILTTAKTWPFTSKLADFGLSNFMGGGHLESKVGTPYFCAREVVTSETYGTKADLWSLGVVAYEMLSGKKPFEGTTTKSVLYAILDGSYSFPQREWAAISEEARHFVASLICIDVHRRMSAEEALQHPWIVNEGRHDVLRTKLNADKRRHHAPAPSTHERKASDELMEHDDD